jgi:beta-lactamase regulating signal transducer with metallopeptidase domain
MMMNWLRYLLEVNLYLTMAYGCYWLLFRKQTFYTANRLYLLLGTVICLMIPLVQVEYKQPIVQKTQPPVTAVQFTRIEPVAITTVPVEAAVTLNKAITGIYLLGAACMLVLFTLKLYSLLKLILKNRRVKEQHYTLVYLDQASTPFSFFSFLFTNEKHNLDENILQHELVHIRQKHSWDIVFTETLKIVNWFNPVVYLLQNSLKALHEYEADRCATNINQHDDYVNLLITQAYSASGVPFANHFSNQQLLKLRIMKIYQKRSGKLARLTYLTAVPLCLSLLCASSLAFSKDYAWIKLRLVTHSTNELTTLNFKKSKGHHAIDTPKRAVPTLKNTKTPPPPPPPAKPTRLKSQSFPPPPSRFPHPAKLPLSKEPMRFPPPKVKPIAFPPPQKTESTPANQSDKSRVQDTLNKLNRTANIELFIINGQAVSMRNLKKDGKKLHLSATEGISVITSNSAEEIRKWGKEAENGVIYLNGKVTIEN